MVPGFTSCGPALASALASAAVDKSGTLLRGWAFKVVLKLAR
jgi:hypothetical protein